MVEVLTGAALSGVLYDMMKHSVSISAQNLKEKLKNWVVGDEIAEALVRELQSLEINDDMSEKAITNKVIESSDINSLLEKVTASTTTIINQTHSGEGDNIAGDKIINN